MIQKIHKALSTLKSDQGMCVTYNLYLKLKKKKKHALYNPLKATLLSLCFNVLYENLLKSIFCMEVIQIKSENLKKNLVHAICMKDQRYSY